MIYVGKLGLTKLLFVVKKYNIFLSIVLKWKCKYRHPESAKIPGRCDAGLRRTCRIWRPLLTFHSA